MMAPMKYITINKLVDTNISTYIAMKIVLTLILSSQVTYTWGDWRCLGGTYHTMTFEDRISDGTFENIRCFCLWCLKTRHHKNETLRFCGSSTLHCEVFMRDEYPRMFVAFRSSYECGKYKEKQCHWQIFKDNVKLYNPKEKKYEDHEYLY